MADPLNLAQVRVLAVDDHRPFLEVARRVVEATPGFCWAGGATSGAEALDAVAVCAPDLALVDVNMPGIDGVELARRLRLRMPRLLVALISAQDRFELPEAAQRLGRTAVLPKEALRSAWLQSFWQSNHIAG